ncbi:MAG: hypothetical protein RL538_528 [Candidatus Parcubacteria bacterium]|jgi:aspartyl-tRNA(Asn)/glutamyl-tRNA(Gln) amidotransferase subunit C
MKREDIAHLASLSRIAVTEPELEKLETELSSIMSYVSAISDIAGEQADPQVGARYNVFRKDGVTNGEDEYTADMIAQMPHSSGRFLKVKKILSIDE